MRTTWPVEGSPGDYRVYCPLSIWRVEGNTRAFDSIAETQEQAVVEAMQYFARADRGWYMHNGAEVRFTYNRLTGYSILVRSIDRIVYRSMLPSGPNRKLASGAWKFTPTGKYKDVDLQQLFTEVDRWISAVYDMEAPQVNAETLCQVAQSFRPAEVESAWNKRKKALKAGEEFSHSLAYSPPTPEACQMSLSAGDFYEFNDGGYLVVSRDVTDVVLQDKNGVDYNLGHFRVKLAVGPGGWFEAKADPLGNNLPNRYESSFNHPHVSSGNAICIGEAGGMLLRFLSQGHYVMAMDALEAVLRTYNPRSPYRALESWLGEMCAKCGTRSGEMRLCRFCETRMCERCLIACQCGRYACESCAVQSYGECDFCHKIVCSRCCTGTPAGNCCSHCESSMESFSGPEALTEAIGRNVCT